MVSQGTTDLVDTDTRNGAVPPGRRSVNDNISHVISELLVGGSLEMSPHRAADAQEVAALLPAGTRVYVNQPPLYSLAQSLPALKALREVGLEPVAHIAARRVASRAEVRSFLERASGEAALSKVLLIGGDEPRPLGPYASGVDLLREEIFSHNGIREVGLPGYPEGHPKIDNSAIERALLTKLAMVTVQGLSAHIVTQFSFAPARIVQYCAELSRKIPTIPLYIGVAGPVEAYRLLRFAQRCGVSASLRALRAQGMGAIRLITNTDPHDQLVAVARYCLTQPSCNVVGAHLFTFGGVGRTVAWINQQIVSLSGAGS